MRCPKCDYISFDHLETCEKCKKDLTSIAAELGGGSYGAEVPRFLVTQLENDDAGDDFGGVVEEGEGIEFGEEFEDSDLNILVSEETDEDIALEDDGGPEIVMDDLEEEIAFDDSLSEVDLGLDEDEEFQFEDGGAEEGDIAISVPDELADISDLSAPVEDGDEIDASFEEEVVAMEQSTTEPTVEAGAESDIDLDDLNLELGGAEGSGESDFELSLDEIDFSEAVPDTAGDEAAEADPLNMDSELDFELDLGGLTLDKDK